VVIDYLAKDYSSFRQALLDFIPTRLPAWTERSEADIGMMLLELFAATADTLSYTQDRVANEAFLDSATQRRSVAAHLALIGYEMDRGASAHTWLRLEVNTTHTLPAGPALPVTNRPLRAGDPVIVFEPLASATLRPEHNAMQVFAWGNANCCLPRDARSVTLDGNYPDLRAGDYLLLDDGQGQRDVVRLTARPEITSPGPAVSPPSSPLGGPVTVVRWSGATPLRHSYCVRARDDPSLPRLVVYGNLVPATHGETVSEELLRKLKPEEKAALAEEEAARPRDQRPPRQRLRLARGPLAYLDPDTPGLPPRPAPAGVEAITDRPPGSLSTLTLKVEGSSGTWQEKPTLLESGPDDQVFRVEVNDEGDATVVLGDGIFGLQPDEKADVTAAYRVGGGAAGNVAADALTLPRPQAGDSIAWLKSVTNPLPAAGGRDPEPREHARRFGPATFRKPLVAVTAADYQAAAQGFTDVAGLKPIQRANAVFCWTGSWLTVTLAVDPLGAETLDPILRRDLLRFLDARRLAGYDLEATRALYVPVELAIELCLAAGFRPGDVQQAVLQALSSGELPGGRKGFFHPDHFTFGDRLYVSRIHATVAAVPGVESAHLTRLARFKAAQPERDTAANLARGYLEVGAGEIVRLDNDRNFPQNGTLGVRVRG
jgi:hypothetical protein